jgi:membrane protein
VTHTDPGSGESSTSESPSRTRRAYSSAQTRGTVAYQRGRLWIENQDPASRKGATIGWVRRYQAADGQLYAVLLAAYLFLTLLPLLLIYSSYLYSDPEALAKRVEHRLRLEGSTSTLLDAVLQGASGHKLSAALIAALDLFFFGLGFGRVLQLAHARSWGFDLRKRAVMDQVLYLEVLGALAVMTLLFFVQTKALRGDPSWIGWVLDIGWFFLVLGFFVWAPRILLHRRVAARDILPGAVFTMICLIGLRIVSGLLLKHWLEWYSRTYGALGIVMAIFFWIIAATTILVLAAALSPALAHRRDLRHGRVAPAEEPVTPG